MKSVMVARRGERSRSLPKRTCGVKEEKSIVSAKTNDILKAALRAWETKEDGGFKYTTGWRQAGKKSAPVLPT
jgi:hypothetical protein